MIVLGAHQNLELHKSYSSENDFQTYDAFGKSHLTAFTPVKPATFEEWLTCLKELGGNPAKYVCPNGLMHYRPYPYFFWVQMD